MRLLENAATWSPFQSREVREICAHMTADERSRATFRAALYGVWVTFTFAMPVTTGLRSDQASVWIGSALLATLHVACIPLWQKRVRRFLCATEWARAQGITPERLALFGRRF